MADASRRQRHKLPVRDGANHARQDDIERQLRILDRPLSFLSDRVRYGKAGQSRPSDGLNYGESGQPNQRSHQGVGNDHKLQNIDPSGGEGGEEAYVGDRMDGNYNNDDLQTKQFVDRNSKKYESLVGDKLNNGKGRGSLRQNSVR